MLKPTGPMFSRSGRKPIWRLASARYSSTIRSQVWILSASSSLPRDPDPDKLIEPPKKTAKKRAGLTGSLYFTFPAKKRFLFRRIRDKIHIDARPGRYDLFKCPEPVPLRGSRQIGRAH